MDRNIKTKLAFTLIELLVVIAIIGILSALIIIGMNSTTQKATVAKGQVFANSLRNSLMADMVSEWKLDDGTGNSTAKDSWASSFANTGTLGTAAVGDVSEPAWLSTGCVSGNCLSFDGTDDYVDFGNNTSLSMGTKNHTVSLWVKFDNATAPQTETLVRCGAGGLGYDGYWFYRTGTRIEMYFSDGTSTYLNNYLCSAGSLTGDTWYNITITLDRDGVAQGHINGIKQTGFSLDLTSQPGDVQNYSSFRIGAYSGTTHRLDGQMDEVRIFHAITTMSQIQQNYYAGLNKLFANRGVETSEYQQRLTELNSNYAKN